MDHLDSTELGYFERRPGSGVWHKAGVSNRTYEPRICPQCDDPFMAVRGVLNGKPGGQKYCSRECVGLSQRKDDALYSTVHQRVRRVRGRADAQLCVDCGGQAAEWSQTHGTTGLDPAHYQPRCQDCHMIYDNQRGEGNGNSKLTEARVRGIRGSTGATHKEIADVHGVSESTVADIRKGRTWGHLTGGGRVDW